MKNEPKAASSGSAVATQVNGTQHPFLWMALLLVIALTVLFGRGFLPNYVAYSNDGPYGLQAAECNQMPSIIAGMWSDLGWLGNEGISPSPNVTSALLFLPLRLYMNLLYPVSLFVVGMGACFCLRQFKLAPMACILGGLAAALNSDFLSTACWGVAPQIISFGATYFALGLLAGTSGRCAWLKVVLAGLAVGVGIMEGFDNGAIFSLFVAAYALFFSLYLQEAGKIQNVPQRFGRGILRIAIVALFAAYISVHALSLLVGTQIAGVASAGQDPETKAAQWEAKTAFSLPPVETLQVAVPGLFGFRNVWHMYDNNQPTDDQYWGLIGASPQQGFWRLVGTGEYVGVLVLVVALWAIFQSFRSRGSPYSQLQRRAIWFWTAMLLVALLLAYGKFGPLYRLFYALPYASTIRNPVKFMHVFSWVIVILFGYGVHGLILAYFQNPVVRTQGLLAQFKKWRTVASSFERRWMNGCFAAIGVSLLGWLLYASGAPSLEDHLQKVGISATDAPGIVRFSLHAVGWFIIFLVLTVGLLALIFSGQFAGPRARWGGVLLGALLVLDLGRADIPWIIFYNLQDKFPSDPIVNFLADKPYEHRVAVLPHDRQPPQQQALLFNAYGSHWNQNLFPLHNIQCFDVSQEPRVAVDKDRFTHEVPPGLTYVLLNVRYLLGPNQQMDPTGKHFRIVKTFNFVPRVPNPTVNSVDWVTKEDPNGELAVIEYLDALPRAKLYAKWQVSSNDDDSIRELTTPGFDPREMVVVAGPVAASVADAVNPPNDAVKITSYKSKHIELDADAKTASVLLMSERYNPKWRVEVDGQPAPLLKCNFIERGVYLPPGKHHVVFRFTPSTTTFYISLSGVVLGFVLCGWVAFDEGQARRKIATNAELVKITAK